MRLSNVVILIVTLAIFQMPVAAQQAAGWQRFQSRERQFSALFPGSVKVLDNGSIMLCMVLKDGGAYSVQVVPRGGNIMKYDQADLDLRASVLMLKFTAEGTPCTFVRNVTQAGLIGKDYIQKHDGVQVGWLRVLMSKKYMYLLGATQVSTPNGTKFFNSFSVTPGS